MTEATLWYGSNSFEELAKVSRVSVDRQLLEGIIGNGVHVPTHYYKIVFDSAGLDAIAFLVPHRAISKGDLPGFIVSVDEVERLTGLDFNSLLDDAVEDGMEDDVEGMW